MLNQITPDNFRKLVLSNFKFLVDEYNFSIISENDWAYTLESQRVRVSVLLERGFNLVVEIEPMGEAARPFIQQSTLPPRLDVVTTSMCLDPNLKYKIEKLGTSSIMTNVPVELEKRAILLKDYCQNLLQGNFDDWPQIKECLYKRAGEFLNLL